MLNEGTSLRVSDASDKTIGTGSIGALHVRGYRRFRKSTTTYMGAP